MRGFSFTSRRIRVKRVRNSSPKVITLVSSNFWVKKFINMPTPCSVSNVSGSSTSAMVSAVRLSSEDNSGLCFSTGMRMQKLKNATWCRQSFQRHLLRVVGGDALLRICTSRSRRSSGSSDARSAPLPM